MRRRRSIFRTDPNASPLINTTPLIDVMLVMLVMFIITISRLDACVTYRPVSIPVPLRCLTKPRDDRPCRRHPLNGEVVDLQLGRRRRRRSARRGDAALSPTRARYLRCRSGNRRDPAERRNEARLPGIHQYAAAAAAAPPRSGGGRGPGRR